MRILILNFILSTAVNGRIIRRQSNRDTMIYAMARGFVRNGHQVTLAAAEEFRPLENEQQLDFDVVYFPSRFRRIAKPSLLPWPKGLGRYLRNHNDDFDIIISVETFSFPTVIAARNCRSKLLVWQEMAFMQHFMGGLPAKIWYRFIAPHFIRNAPVVPQSQKAKDFISHYLSNVKDNIVGHGSDSELFFPSEKTENYFVVISMLVARKQIDRIIEKFGRFLSNTDNATYKLRIVGEGPELDRLKTISENLGLSSGVIFEGFLGHEKIAEISRKAKALLIDTRQDNNMVTIPESIVNGTPILTNMVPNNAVFVKDLALGIARDEWDWQDMQEIVSNNSYYRENCVKHRHRFSNDGCAETLIDIYLRNKPTTKNRLASAIYRHAVRSPWFHTTVTSKAYQQWFNRKLGLDIDYPLLRDVYYDSYEPDPAMLRECDGSVFCGGRNSRDWDMMVTLARIMPERRFCFIMPDDRYSEFEHKMPENVEALHEVPMDTFVDRMSRASVICMPVTTDAPAGLITMFQAAGYKKPIISTYTVTTSEYLTPERGYLLPSNDAELWASTIRDIFDDPGAALKKACEFHRFVTGECNEASYVSRIEEIIRGFVP